MLYPGFQGSNYDCIIVVGTEAYFYSHFSDHAALQSATSGNTHTRTHKHAQRLERPLVFVSARYQQPRSTQRSERQTPRRGEHFFGLRISTPGTLEQTRHRPVVPLPETRTPHCNTAIFIIDRIGTYHTAVVVIRLIWRCPGAVKEICSSFRTPPTHCTAVGCLFSGNSTTGRYIVSLAVVCSSSDTGVLIRRSQNGSRRGGVCLAGCCVLLGCCGYTETKIKGSSGRCLYLGVCVAAPHSLRRVWWSLR